MKKVVKIIEWVVVNAFMAWLAWYWLLGQVNWAGNVFKFMAWVNFIITILIFLNARGDEGYRERTKKRLIFSKFKEVSLLYSIVLSCFLAGFGKFFYAGLILTQEIIYLSLRSKRGNEK